MNADSVNKWLTLSASIGVVFGLILLLVELDQNSDLVRAQIHQARSDTYVSMTLERANSEFLLPVLQKFFFAGSDDLAAMDQMTAMEKQRMYVYFLALHADFDNLFYQYQQGFLDEEYYQYRVVVPIRIFAPWWKKLDFMESVGRRPSFDAEIKRIMSVRQ